MSGLPGNPADASPAPVSASVAFVAVLGACFASSTGPIQTTPLLLEAIGLTLYAGGVLLRRDDYGLTGRILTGVGFVVAAAAIVGVVALSPPLPVLLVCLTWGTGVLVVTLGLFPIYARLARSLAITGIALVCIGVMVNAITSTPAFWRSTVAVSLVFLSWDAADRAITLEEQVGGAAATASVEVVGTATSLVVTLTATILAVAIARLPVESPSLVGLALLLVAIVAFILSLSHVLQLPEAQR